VARRDRGAGAGAAVTALLEARAVDRDFRSGGGTVVHALAQVSVAVPRGAFCAVTGPSGGGKTTLRALLAALDGPTRGDVLFGGRDIVRASEAERSRVRRRLGIVFQQTPLLAGLPLWENVTYPLVPRGVPGAERRRLADGLLARVGLAGRERARAGELSGGELQRAGIARALAGSPEVLLADEPTSDLDEESAAAVVDLFRGVHAGGTTVVVATHDPGLVALATLAVRLRGGRLAGAAAGNGNC